MIDVLRKAVEVRESGIEAVLITVIEKTGYGPSDTHFKLLVTATGERFGTVGGGAVEKSAIEKAEELLRTKSNHLQTYNLTDSHDLLEEEAVGMICGGKLTLFFEYLGAPETVVIFGGGHVGSALAYHLSPLNFKVHIIDNRPEISNNMEGITVHHVERFTDAVERGLVPPNAWVIIVTYSHDEDYRIVHAVLESKLDPKYVGLIGSKTKKRITLDRLKTELGDRYREDVLFTPVGLNIGGKTPHEIALSVAAEIQAIRHGTANIRHFRDEA